MPRNVICDSITPVICYSPSSLIVSSVLGHHHQFHPLVPADAFPEGDGVWTVGEDEDVALVNSGSSEGGEAPLDQHSAHSSAAMGFADGQVVDVAAPAIVAAEHGPHEMLSVVGHEAEARVAVKIARYVFLRIRVT